METTSRLTFFCIIHSCFACGGGGGGGNAGGGNEDVTPEPRELMPTGPPKYIKGQGQNPDFWVPPPGHTKEEIIHYVYLERERIKQLEKEYEEMYDTDMLNMMDPDSMTSSERREWDALSSSERREIREKWDALSSSEKRERKRKWDALSSQEKRNLKKGRPKDADDDWPAEWKDLGYPYKGNAPPKYAIAPQAAGKAGLCFLPPVIGTCKNYMYRYGYNPYTELCERFVYSGCGGNANNFYTLKRCTEVCVGPTKATCIGSNNTTPKGNWYEIPTIPVITVTSNTTVSSNSTKTTTSSNAETTTSSNKKTTMRFKMPGIFG